jgi:hypothetical protein
MCCVAFARSNVFCRRMRHAMEAGRFTVQLWARKQCFRACVIVEGKENAVRIVVIWVMRPRGFVGGYQCFGEMYCLYFHPKDFPTKG